MKVYCQNFQKHNPDFGKPFKIFGVTLNSIWPEPVLCEERKLVIDDPNPQYFCPKCKEYVDVGPPQIASWGVSETRAGYPKSMTRKL